MSKTTAKAIYMLYFVVVGYTKLISHNLIIVCLILYNHQNENNFSFSTFFFRDFILHSHSLRKNARNKQEENIKKISRAIVLLNFCQKLSFKVVCFISFGSVDIKSCGFTLRVNARIENFNL